MKKEKNYFGECWATDYKELFEKFPYITSEIEELNGKLYHSLDVHEKEPYWKDGLWYSDGSVMSLLWLPIEKELSKDEIKKYYNHMIESCKLQRHDSKKK